MSTAPDQLDDAKDRVRAQYGSVGDAYVRSAGHATGDDLARMVEVAEPLPTDLLIDVATGGGHVARTFAPHVARAIATDLTPEILVHAGNYFRELGLTNVETQLADAEALPFPDATADIVTCRIAPHHFPHPDRFVQEATRVLKPGGRFVLIDSTVPAGEAGDFFNRFEKLRDPSHVRSLTIDAWDLIITAAGLTIEAVEDFPKRHDFDDWTARSRMTPEDKAALEALLLGAPDAIRAILKVEVEHGNVVAFTDTKTLFAAIKE